MGQQQSILNPEVPFSHTICEGLKEGKMVLIQGQVLPNVTRFAVNLVCQNGDIAFHFNPRLDEARHVVVCNTQLEGCWGTEERTASMPFQPNNVFEITINVNRHCYQVSVNGKHFLEYNHRIPFWMVKMLQIKGNVSLNCIRFTDVGAPPPYNPPAYDFVQATSMGTMFAQPNLFQPNMAQSNFAQTSLGQQNFTQENFANPSNAGYRGTTLTKPSVPLLVAIPGNLTQFRKIMIVGNVPLHADRFAVNLKNSMTGNIALHINPRLKERAVVRNTCISNDWGSEERHISSLPFSPGQPFHMEITNLKNSYQVAVNGIVAFEYTHRIPLGKVDQLEITGDVSLFSVQYLEPSMLPHP